MTRPDWADVAMNEGRRTAHEFVRDTLRRAIVRGEITGGARLIQSELATSLNVSTTPVREALRDLATDGLITLDRHRGGIVKELDWAHMEGIRLIRDQLDPLAVRLACARITDDEIAEAESLARQMEKEKDLANWVELNRRFHQVFHEATGLPRLIEILKSLEDESSVYVAQAQRWHPEIRRQANPQHQLLLAAWRARDVEKLIELVSSHANLPLEMTEPRERTKEKSKERTKV